MSSTAKNIAKKYSRIVSSSKKNNKRCPVLLDEEANNCIKLILKYRDEANVHPKNPFIFGRPNKGAEFDWVEANPLLTKYSEACGAEFPKRIRGANVRRHIATVGLSLNLTDNQVSNLSKFMGHGKDIHVGFYQQPVAVKDIVEVSQWLEYASGDFLVTPNGNVLEEEESISDMEEDDEPISNDAISGSDLNQQNEELEMETPTDKNHRSRKTFLQSTS